MIFNDVIVFMHDRLDFLAMRSKSIVTSCLLILLPYLFLVMTGVTGGSAI